MLSIKSFETTVEDLGRPRDGDGQEVPGVIHVFAPSGVVWRTLPLEGGALELGRPLLGPDERASRKHARVAFDGSTWTITDLESRNGTFLDGKPVRGQEQHPSGSARVLRIGNSLLLFARDLRAYAQGPVLSEGVVAGPQLRAAYQAIERAALLGDTLFIRGESGSGKELAARRFHESGGRGKTPFIAVNCAAIPETLAERLLFGAKKGAFSGATADAIGYLEAASGGTLFLDEIAELDLAVQAKLLRVLESREVVALGDSSPRRVEIRVCSATHQDLRSRVAAGSFRQDLYFRIGRPEVFLPPLRDRPEEIAQHIAREVAALGQAFTMHASFVEACLLRAWPGNVRELRIEVRRAAQNALAGGRSILEVEDLPAGAGEAFEGPVAPPPSAGSAPASPSPASRVAASAPVSEVKEAKEPKAMPARPLIEEALRAEHGNVTAAARRLDIHRNQLRRWLEKNGIDPLDLA